MSSIELIIGGRKYPLKVSREDQDALLSIQKKLNHDIQSVQMQYAKRDRQDALAMTLISYAKRLHDLENQYKSEEDQLKGIEEELDQHLAS